MNQIMQTVTRYQGVAAAFWQARSEQERKMLTYGALAVLFALVYSILIEPAVSGRAQLNKSLPLLRQQAAELQALAGEAAALSGQAPARVAPMSRASLTSSMAAAGLSPQTLDMTGEFAKLKLTAVPFAGLIRWLDTVRRDSRISVQDANVSAQSVAGMVDASVTLHQSADAVQ